MGKLPAEQIELLESVRLGCMIITPRKVEVKYSTKAKEAKEKHFNTMLYKLKEFKKKESHCQVPQRYEMDQELGRWVKNRCDEKKRGTLAQERVDKLNEIGFRWSVPNPHLE